MVIAVVVGVESCDGCGSGGGESSGGNGDDRGGDGDGTGTCTFKQITCAAPFSVMSRDSVFVA